MSAFPCGLSRATYVRVLPSGRSRKNPRRSCVYKICMEAKDIVEIYPALWEEEIKEYPVESYGLGIGPGWWPLVADLVREIREIDEARGTSSKLQQIKEKFGGLRFYLRETTNDHWEAISRAESKSLRTCETCGATGLMYNDGWIKTLCREHALESWQRRSEWKRDLPWERCWRHDVNNLANSPENSGE